MDPDQIRKHLSTMDKSDIHKLMVTEARNCQHLFMKRNKSANSELTQPYNARREAAAWSYSEQYEKSKAALMIIIKFLE